MSGSCSRGVHRLRHLFRDLIDGVLDLRVMLGNMERRSVLLQCFRKLAAPVVDFGEATDRRKVFRRRAKDVLELLTCLVEASQLEQRAPERDASGQVGGVTLQSGLARGYRFFEAASTPVFFGESRKRDGRRVHLDPAFQFFDARALGPQSRSVPPIVRAGAMLSASGNCTGTDVEVVPLRPASSTTTSVTV